MQARYEAGLMETEAPIDRSAVIEEVQQLLGTVARLIGVSVGETRERDRR